jgi:threonyl-tRNA synthetase
VVGDREVEQGMLAVRGRKGEDLGSVGIDAFLGMLAEHIQNRT